MKWSRTEEAKGLGQDCDGPDGWSRREVEQKGQGEDARD